MKKYIFVLLLLILAAGFYFASKKANLEAEVQVYSNPEYGVRLEYPNNYIAFENTVGAEGEPEFSSVFMDRASYEETVQSETAREWPPAITYEVFLNPDKLEVEEWLRTTPRSNYGLGDGEIRTISIDGRTGFVYSWSGLYEGESVAFARGNKIYIFSVSFFEKDDAIYSDFENILQSLEFVEGSGAVAKNLTKERGLIQGKWVSSEDSKYEIEFIDNRFEERYEGMAEEDGGWKFLTDFSKESDGAVPAFDIGPNDLFLKLSRPEGDYYYKVFELTESSLVINYLESGSTLEFVRP
ncbi:MAG: hypothetical protein Q8Q32_00795 [bacterium]|nr:hypothetical protein [bacterium]